MKMRWRNVWAAILVAVLALSMCGSPVKAASLYQEEEIEGQPSEEIEAVEGELEEGEQKPAVENAEEEKQESAEADAEEEKQEPAAEKTEEEAQESAGEKMTEEIKEPAEENVEGENQKQEEEEQDTAAEKVENAGSEEKAAEEIEQLEVEVAPFHASLAEEGVYGEYGTYSLYAQNTLQMYGAGLYADVPETSGWRYEAIKYVTEHGIMVGISGTDRFDPDKMMTRAMFATVIYRMAGSPQASYSVKFPDVPDNNYYSVPISWANSVGIIRGHSNTGLFGTYENITREDLVTMIFRYAQYIGRDTSERASLSSFPDAGEVSSYAVDAMQWAVSEGIIQGRSNTGELDPKGSALRVECAAIAQRFLTGSGGEPSVDGYAIMGQSTVTIDQMVRYYNANASYPAFYSNTEAATIEDFCRIYYEEAQAEGVKAEVAFCQAMKETGFLKFGGDVGIEQFNFAGLGATGNGATGLFFESPRIGIRAQIQHLKAYASADSLNNACVDPRFQYVARGCAPYVEWLGVHENPYGRGWATAVGYGDSIVNMIAKLKTF